MFILSYSGHYNLNHSLSNTQMQSFLFCWLRFFFALHSFRLHKINTPKLQVQCDALLWTNLYRINVTNTNYINKTIWLLYLRGFMSHLNRFKALPIYDSLFAYSDFFLYSFFVCRNTVRYQFFSHIKYVSSCVHEKKNYENELISEYETKHIQSSCM